MTDDSIIIMSGKPRTKEEEKAEFDRLFAVLSSLSSSSKKAISKDVPLIPNEPTIDVPKDVPKDIPKDVPKDPLIEASKDLPKEEKPSPPQNEIVRPPRKPYRKKNKENNRKLINESPGMIHMIIDEHNMKINHYEQMVMPISLQRKYIIDRKKTHSDASSRCPACLRVFSSNATYLQHFETSTLCTTILTNQKTQPLPIINRPLHILINDWMDMSILEPNTTTYTCKHCKSCFTKRGNLNKHLYTSIACNRVAFAEFKRIVAAS